MTLDGKETPMNSTTGPKAAEPHDASNAGADERLVHAHEEIKRADEQLARLSEQVARMERNAARAPSALAGLKSPSGRRRLAARVGLPLVAFVAVAALVWQSSLGGGAKRVAAPSPPQLVSNPSLPQENPPSRVGPAPPAVQLAAAEPTPAQATPAVQTATPKATPMAQAAPQDAAPTSAVPTATVPTAAAAPADQTQLLQTMARDLANLQRSIERLKATQQQTAGDNAKEIAALKASQEEIKRGLAKVSEQNQKASPPPAQPNQPAPALRKPERTVQSPRERARPRMRPDWYYEDW
jgi:hypothetical protein